MSLKREVSAALRTGCLLTALWLTILRTWAVPGDPSYVAFEPKANAVVLADARALAAIHVDGHDWPGVIRVARDLQADVARVTGRTPALATASDPAARDVHAVIVGTIGRSALIDRLVREGKLDVGVVRGRWEAWVSEVVEHPLPGVARALVIAGSDKRGTIYGTYDLSEQIGVSPWYWWADVPVTRRVAVSILPGRRVNTGPVVKYRGIFLNDEAPALTGWSKEKFGGFNASFYAHVFELMLRLRANYLWPAMWLPSAFIADDPRNAPQADEFGVVMGTTHHEPMMRAHDEWRREGNGGPWDYAKNAAALRAFWRGGVQRVTAFEGIVSLGMRGDGDSAMGEGTNVALLERIVADQRAILRDVTGRPLEQVPQLWALYKEVQGYYERGMRVPDDVTLLWCDDNWGNIRRLPTPAERSRAGGAGVYYHFDYVGAPRNYRWINTVPLTKIWEQLHLAWRHDANRIWIVNVGDLKPMEFPTEFFLRMAWEPGRWNHDDLTTYSRQWAAREFGPEAAVEVAALINGYAKLNGRRKPELLAPDTYSLVHDREAERVIAEWRDLAGRAEALNQRLTPDRRDAFFQLVLYPVEASANLHELYVAVGRNLLYARQGRSDAVAQAARARACFARDGKLAATYHQLGGGRWNHLMAQIKLGYTYWQQPDIETMPAVSEVRPRAGASPGVAIEGSEIAWPSYNAPRALLPPLDAFTRSTRWIEVFNRGQTPFTFTATASVPWATLSPASGTVGETVRLEVGSRWEDVPPGETTVTVTIVASTGERIAVDLPVLRPSRLPAPEFTGFVESNRQVAIEAPHFARAVNGDGVEWKTLPDFGRTLGGVTVFPVDAAQRIPGGNSPRLEFDVHLESTGESTLELHLAPSLDFQSGDGLRFGVSVDEQPPRILKVETAVSNAAWEQAVSDGVRRVRTRLVIDRPGPHVIKFWLVTPGVVLQRIVLDAGGVRPTYLGPPESARWGATVRAPRSR